MHKTLIVIFLFLVIHVPMAHALQVGQADFPNYYEEDVGEKHPLKLKLLGAGLARFMAYKVIAVGLYVDQEASSANVSDDIFKRIDVEYFSNVSGKDLVKSTRKGIEDNINRDVLDQLEERIERFYGFIEGVEAGDRYSFRYRPGKGTEVVLNGKKLGTIEGLDFVNALFSVYIGEKPLDERAKKSLLERMENERVSF